MVGNATATHVVSRLGELLAYPDSGFQERFENARAEIREISPETAAHLDRFADEACNLSLDSAQEAYTRAFDVNPLCVPYLSVHLFGQESFKRAELMTGLSEAFHRARFEYGPELPDHIAVVLQGAEMLDSGDWEELKLYCLDKPMGEMTAALDKAQSPWRHLLYAVRSALDRGESNDA